MDSAPGPGPLVQRFDFGRLGQVERTPQGGVRVDAGLTRVGVFSYPAHDGKEIREYRPPEEVFHQDSLATLADAPVTDLHPPVMVGPDNFQTYSRGHVVHGTVRQDGEQVAARLVLQDGSLISAVERKDRREVSCGYQCRVEETPGVTPDGQRYDRIQRGIRYNHVAIVPHGRAGSNVALRLDAAGNHVVPGTTEIGARPREEIKMKPSIRIDGVDYPLTTEAEVQAAVQAHGRFQARLDAQVQDLTKARDQAQGRADAAEAKVQTLNTELAEAKDPKRLDARVQARAELVQKAAAILGQDVKLDGLTDAEIRSKVLQKARPEVKLDGRSEDYIQGLFSGLTTEAAAPRKDSVDPDGLADLRRGTNPDPARKDAVDPNDAEAARKRMDTANRTAWQGPLAFSKDPPRS
jgi:hypothetical protein